MGTDHSKMFNIGLQHVSISDDSQKDQDFVLALASGDDAQRVYGHSTTLLLLMGARTFIIDIIRVVHSSTKRYAAMLPRLFVPNALNTAGIFAQASRLPACIAS